MKHINKEGFDFIEAPKCLFGEVPSIVEQANAQAIGGHTDWVCPDTITLLALQKIAPLSGWVWSSSPYVGLSDFAWGVGFVNGGVDSYNRGYDLHVRLVRASQLLDLGAAVHRASIEAAGIVAPKEQTFAKRCKMFEQCLPDATYRELLKELHAEMLAALAEQPAQQEPVGRTDRQIVDQTGELAVWLLSWRFGRQPETLTPMRETRHPMAEQCWSAACHIQEMLTATDPENSVAVLDDAPQAQPAQPQRKATTYAERFAHAVAVLCSAQPPADMVAEWVGNVEVNGEHRLQGWVGKQAATPSWAQCIVILDAAHVLASDPEEGEGHEAAPQPARQEAVAHINSNGVVYAAGYHWSDAEILRPLVYGDVSPSPQAQPAQLLTEWQSIETALPEPGKPVLVACGNQVLRAVHAPKFTLSEDEWGEFLPDGGEYDEATDTTYWPKNWYEWNQHEETHWRLDDAPTHWMPLPAPVQEPVAWVNVKHTDFGPQDPRKPLSLQELAAAWNAQSDAAPWGALTLGEMVAWAQQVPR